LSLDTDNIIAVSMCIKDE